MTNTTGRKNETFDMDNGEKRRTLPRWLQNIIGMVVGASLVGFPALWLSDRDRLNHLDHVVTNQQRELEDIRLYNRQPKFTKEQAQQIIIPIKKDIENLKEMCQQTRIEIKELEVAHTGLLREFFELRTEVLIGNEKEQR